MHQEEGSPNGDATGRIPAQVRQDAMARRQDAITLGIESGTPQPFEGTAFRLRMRQKYEASGSL